MLTHEILLIKKYKILFVLSLISWNLSETYGRFSIVPLTNDEKLLIPQFRQKVQTFALHDYQLGDEYLIPWLRAKNYNVQKALEMFNKAMIWRKENQIDDIRQEKAMLELKRLNKYPSDFSSFDKNGAPALISACGKWDVRKAMLSGKKEELTRWVDFNYENVYTILRKERESGRTNATQSILIADIANYNAKQHGCAACLPFFYDLITHYEWYYPGGASHIILINVPNIFKMILDYMKSLMTKATREGLHVFSYDRNEWGNELLKHFDRAELPIQWGGRKKVNL